ncbi:hypothetical protein C8R46DRAFT_855214, partial [Mycena filopes]
RGCLTKTGVCRARFPREVVQHSTVSEDGHITIKHKEPMLNAANPIVTFLNRCNSDVTSLLSGTAVKAVVSYVSDYVSKISLKSFQLFASVYDVFTNKSQSLYGDVKQEVTSRDLMRKMVNSLSSKMEIGSPMASMYVLGNPDHYTSHKYTPFPWRSYVSFVKNFWAAESLDDSGSDSDVEKIALDKDRETGRFIASSGVDDYRYRPAVFERVTLYEWIQCGDKKARTVKQKERFLELLYASHDLAASFEDESDVDKDTSSVRISDLSDDDLSSDWLTDDEDGIVVAKQRRADKDKRPRSYPFLSDHPRYRTHAATCDFTHINSVIPNFIGGALPRSDKGDRGYYGMTMLTLFKPWRSPGDLKDSVSTWEQAFGEHEFTKRQRQLLQNFNVRYECNDERDDHFAQLKRQ